MATFDRLVKLFRTGLASPFEAEPTIMLPIINIELESLDHDGRRSSERRRGRSYAKLLAVRFRCPWVIDILINIQSRADVMHPREPKYLAPRSFGGPAAFYGMSI